MNILLFCSHVMVFPCCSVANFNFFFLNVTFCHAAFHRMYSDFVSCE